MVFETHNLVFETAGLVFETAGLVFETTGLVFGNGWLELSNRTETSNENEQLKHRLQADKKYTEELNKHNEFLRCFF